MPAKFFSVRVILSTLSQFLILLCRTPRTSADFSQTTNAIVFTPPSPVTLKSSDLTGGPLFITCPFTPSDHGQGIYTLQLKVSNVTNGPSCMLATKTFPNNTNSTFEHTENKCKENDWEVFHDGRQMSTTGGLVFQIPHLHCWNRVYSYFTCSYMKQPQSRGGESNSSLFSSTGELNFTVDPSPVESSETPEKVEYIFNEEFTMTCQSKAMNLSNSQDRRLWVWERTDDATRSRWLPADNVQIHSEDPEENQQCAFPSSSSLRVVLRDVATCERKYRCFVADEDDPARPLENTIKLFGPVTCTTTLSFRSVVTGVASFAAGVFLVSCAIMTFIYCRQQKQDEDKPCVTSDNIEMQVLDQLHVELVGIRPTSPPPRPKYSMRIFGNLPKFGGEGKDDPARGGRAPITSWFAPVMPDDSTYTASGPSELLKVPGKTTRESENSMSDRMKVPLSTVLAASWGRRPSSPTDYAQ